jgi:hypothetical protein
VDGFDLVRVTASFPRASTGATLGGASWAATRPNVRAHASAQRSSAFFMGWIRVRRMETVPAAGRTDA